MEAVSNSEFEEGTRGAAYAERRESLSGARPTHVEYMDFVRLHRLLEAHGVERERSYSFPFPRIVGRVFPHNEFVVVGRRSPSRGALPDPA